jgi:hypothetical protein
LRLLALLIHTFLNPLEIVPGILVGLFARRMWQAASGGAIIGAAAILVTEHLHQSPLQLRPAVTGAIVCGAWASLAFWLRRWLHGAK